MKQEQESSTLSLLEKTFLSIKECSAYTGLAVQTIYNYTSRKQIPYSKPSNGKVYFSRDELDKWLQQNKSEASA